MKSFIGSLSDARMCPKNAIVIWAEHGHCLDEPSPNVRLVSSWFHFSLPSASRISVGQDLYAPVCICASVCHASWDNVSTNAPGFHCGSCISSHASAAMPSHQQRSQQSTGRQSKPNPPPLLNELGRPSPVLSPPTSTEDLQD